MMTQRAQTKQQHLEMLAEKHGWLTESHTRLCFTHIFRILDQGSQYSSIGGEGKDDSRRVGMTVQISDSDFFALQEVLQAADAEPAVAEGLEWYMVSTPLVRHTVVLTKQVHQPLVFLGLRGECDAVRLHIEIVHGDHRTPSPVVA